MECAKDVDLTKSNYAYAKIATLSLSPQFKQMHNISTIVPTIEHKLRERLSLTFFFSWFDIWFMEESINREDQFHRSLMGASIKVGTI